MRRLDHRGVALMLVLWLLVVLGVIATAIVGATHADATLTRNLRARTTARYAAESGILVATIRLKRALADAALHNPDRHFTALRDVQLGDGRFGIAIVDLNARLDLNRSDEEMLRAFFAQFTTESRAARIAAGIADWKDADDTPRPDGAELGDYAAAGSPYVPRNAPLDRLDDLAHVLGVGDSLVRLVAPFVTVESDGLINIHSAPEPVIAALPGMGRARARDVVARRGSGDEPLSPESLRDLGAAFPRVTTTPSRLLIVSRGWQDGHALTHEIQAVYGIAGRELYLLTWRERDL